jgi:hypothetical protein
MINQVIIEALNFLSNDFNLSAHGSVAVLLAAALYQGISDLEIKDTTDTARPTPCLDIHLNINSERQ